MARAVGGLFTVQVLAVVVLGVFGNDQFFDPDALFASDFDINAADDLFSLDVLEDMTVDEGKKGTLDWETATKLGLLGE